MKKKLLAMLLVLLVAAGGLFAASTSTGDDISTGDGGKYSISVSANGNTRTYDGINNVLKYSLGIIPPAILVAIFLWRIVAAYLQVDQDPQKIKKTVVQFIFVIFIGVGWFFLIMVLLGNTGDIGKGFVAGLEGANATSLPPTIQ